MFLQGILLVLAAASSLALDLWVNELDDEMGTEYSCALDRCNFRAAWELCNDQLGIECNIHLLQGQQHVINGTLGNLELRIGSMITIIGNDATIKALPNAAEVDLGDFPFYTGLLEDTMSATQNVATACVQACPGDWLEFSACGETTYGLDDTYFRLFDAAGQEAAQNDNYCGSASTVQYLVPLGNDCQEYCLHVGCWGQRICEAEVTLDRIVPEPATEVVIGDFPLRTGLLQDTMSATQNVATACVQVCPGDWLEFSACGGTMYGLDDTYFRLFDAAGQEVARNDDFCGLTSAIRYVVPLGSYCQEYCLHVGCFDGKTCEAEVSLVRIVRNQEPEPPAEVDLGDFPFHTGLLKDTMSAAQNVAIACVQACPGDGLEFSACGGTMYGLDDTYFRLFNAAGREIDRNDDYCGSASAIQYVVPLGSDCQEYCLHVGCWDRESCEAEVTLVRTSPPTSHGVFKYAGAAADGSTQGHTWLSLHNTTFHGFSALEGGVLYSSGDLNLSISDCSFLECSALSGGALFITDNQAPVLISNSFFGKNTVVLDGGAVYIGVNVTNLAVKNCTFNGNSAKLHGGAVVLADSNHGALFQDCEFHACSAKVGGGGLALLERNDHVSVLRSVFKSCRAYGRRLTDLMEGVVMEGGGGLFLRSENNHVNLRWSAFVKNAGSFGGGLSVAVNNEDLLVERGYFSRCVTVDYTGGGIYIGVGNTDAQILHTDIAACSSIYDSGGGILVQSSERVLIDHTDIWDCTAGSYGGGLAILHSCSDAVVRDVHISSCTAGGGGGIAVLQDSLRVVLQSVLIEGCSTAGEWHLGGGGIYSGSQNDHLTMSNVSIFDCYAKGHGGGIYSQSSDSMKIVASTIKDCTAAQSGGGMCLKSRHSNVIILNSTVCGCQAEYGGGLAIVEKSKLITVVNTALLSNYAHTDGGGMYVGVEVVGLQLLGWRSYQDMAVFQTKHPYEYAKEPLTWTVTVPGALGFYISFDPLSELSSSDYCFMESASVRYLQIGALDSWPGISTVAQFLDGDTVTTRLVTYAYPKKTTMADDYYGFRAVLIPVFDDVVQPVIFHGNTAGGNGGGMYCFTNSDYSLLVGAQYLENTAGVSGGGLYLHSSIVGLIAHQTVFDANRATTEYGGGACVASNCYEISFQECNFTGNLAGTSGGALALVNKNRRKGTSYNNVARCRLHGNTAAEDGGAIYLGTENQLYVTGTTVEGNSAGRDGGGIALADRNTVLAQNVTVIGNIAAQCGGGTALGYRSDVTLRHSELTDNQAVAGGAFCIRAMSKAFISNTTMQSNSAGHSGGALFLSGGSIPFLTDCIIADNTAHRGSALYLNHVVNTSLPSPANAAGTAVLDNQAAVGTLFWVQGTMQEPTLLEKGLVFSGNEVQSGLEFATQAVTLRAPAEVAIRRYGAFIDPIELSLLDAYGVVSPVNDPSHVVVSIPDAAAAVEGCNGRPPFLSGTDAGADGVLVVHGQATLRSLEAVCSPGGSITVQFTAHLTDQPELPQAQQGVVASTRFVFRPCVAGEYIVRDKCEACPAGSYSLLAEVDEETKCQPCPPSGKAVSCQGAQIVLEPSHWRRHPYSEAILTCPREVQGCKGGNSTGDSSCLPGHEGPLCSVCSDAHYLSGTQCLACTASDKFGPTTTLYIVIAASSFLVLLSVLVHKSRRTHSDASSGIMEPVYYGLSWLVEEGKSLESQIKILITTFQICTAVPVSMNVSFPTRFTQYLSAMSVVNLNVVGVIPLNCSGITYNFIDKLLMTTLAPVGLSILLGALCLAEYHAFAYRNQDSADVKDGQNKIVSRYATMFLFLTYLVLPYVSTTIFQTFLCTNLDPDNEDSDASDRYLSADMRISCDSDYYHRGVIYAAFMAVLYVGGIPLMYLAVLYRSRHEIRGRTVHGDKEQGEGAVRKEEEGSAATNSLDARTDPAALHARTVSFLWEAYEPRFWYWEVVETTRRLVLTAVLSVCGAGTGGQAVLALLLSLVYIKLYGHYRPYANDRDDLGAEVGQYQILLTFLGALICQRRLLGGRYGNAVSGAMIVINMSVGALFAYNVYCKLRQTLKEKQKPGQVVPISDLGKAEEGEDEAVVELVKADCYRQIPSAGAGEVEGQGVEGEGEGAV